MYLRNLKIHNLKLLREVDLSFTREDGSIRPWTVFVAENGLCKTALLQAIALAASGVTLGSELADVISLPDLRLPPNELMLIGAEFTFSQKGHAARRYPGMREKPSHPPVLRSSVAAESAWRDLVGSSRYSDVEHTSVFDPIREARRNQLPGWFVASYGTTRCLPSPRATPGQGLSDPVKQRMENLFERGTLIATGFADLFEPARSKAYARVLKQVLLQGNLLPRLVDLELRSQGTIRTQQDYLEAHRFELDLGKERVKVPATWLSRGYQGTLAWIADLIGHIFLEAGAPVEPEQMEGLVLIDELDLHLHPRWQAPLIPALKAAFPRLQFIASTRSAMLLQGLEQEELFLLRQNEEGNVHAVPAPKSPARMTGSELFDAFFDIPLAPGRSPAAPRQQRPPAKKKKSAPTRKQVSRRTAARVKRK